MLFQVYLVSKGTLKTANKQYTSVKNDYEMTFNNETSVIPCDDADDLPTVQFEFVPINQLENMNKDTMLGEEFWWEMLVWGCITI